MPACSFESFKLCSTFEGTMKSERRDKWQKYHPLQCLVSYISMPEQHIPPIFLLPFPYPLLKKQSPPPLGSKSHPKPEEQPIIDLSNIDVSSDQKIILICGYVPRLMPEWQIGLVLLCFFALHGAQRLGHSPWHSNHPRLLTWLAPESHRSASRLCIRPAHHLSKTQALWTALFAPLPLYRPVKTRTPYGDLKTHTYIHLHEAEISKRRWDNWELTWYIWLKVYGKLKGYQIAVIRKSC